MTGLTHTGAAKKKPYHHEDLANALLETATALVEVRGGAAFTLRELAKEIGVTHASVYRHFSNKAALMDALVARGFEKLLAYQIEELEAAPADPMERMWALDRAYMRFAMENKSLFTLIFSFRPDEDSRGSARSEMSARAFSTLVGVVGECQRAGLIIPGDTKKIAGYLTLAPHGYAAYTIFGHQPIEGDDGVFPDQEALSFLGLIPVLTNPPPPEEISKRYFPG